MIKAVTLIKTAIIKFALEILMLIKSSCTKFAILSCLDFPNFTSFTSYFFLKKYLTPLKFDV